MPPDDTAADAIAVAIHVANSIEGAKNDGLREKGFYGPLNLGNPGEFTMLELVEKVLRATGSKSRLVKKALPPDDPRQRKPEIALAGSKLGWEPKVSLDDGLKETIAYFKKLLAG